jgi:hypothetical protein
VLPARDHEGSDEQRKPDGDEGLDARQRPAGNLGRLKRVADQREHGEEIEEAMREHGSDERRRRAAPRGRQAPAQYGDAGDLARPRGQHRVGEQTDAEGGKDRPVARVRRRQRLVDDEVPCDRPGRNGGEVDRDGERDPVPLDEVERGPAPPQGQTHEREQPEADQHPEPGLAESRPQRRRHAFTTGRSSRLGSRAARLS